MFSIRNLGTLCYYRGMDGVTGATLHTTLHMNISTWSLFQASRASSASVHVCIYTYKMEIYCNHGHPRRLVTVWKKHYLHLHACVRAHLLLQTRCKMVKNELFHVVELRRSGRLHLPPLVIATSTRRFARIFVERLANSGPNVLKFDDCARLMRIPACHVCVCVCMCACQIKFVSLVYAYG